jgi:hypothetical protein
LPAALIKFLDEVKQNIAVNDVEEYADFLKKLVEVLKNFKKQAELKNKKK